MTYTFAILLAILAFLNKNIGATWLYPPALFAAIWAVLILGVAASGSYFYRIHLETLAIYLLGAVCLSLGGLASLLLRPKTAKCTCSPAHMAFIDRGLTIGLFVLAVCTPFYLYYTKEYLAGASGSWFDPVVWQQIRAENIAREPDADKSLVDIAAAAVLVFSVYLPLASFMERANGRWARVRTYGAVVLGLSCNLATASRGGAFLIVIGLVALALAEKLTVSPKLLALLLLSTLGVYAPAAVFMNKGGGVSLSLSENISGVLDTVRSYALSGLVAFDAVVREPQSVPSAWNIDRFFLLTANKLGAHFEVAPIHAEFTLVGDGLYQNIYTMYFAYYPDFGLPGVIGITFFIGVVMTWLYVKLKTNDKLAKLMFSVGFVYICLSGFNENFFLQLNVTLKGLLFGILLYKLPGRLFPIAPCPGDAAYLKKEQIS